jgi:hypothetical protein
MALKYHRRVANGIEMHDLHVFTGRVESISADVPVDGVDKLIVQGVFFFECVEASLFVGSGYLHGSVDRA